jgi:hypothetical protein
MLAAHAVSDKRIPNWRKSVSGYRGHFATGQRAEVLSDDEKRSALEAWAARFVAALVADKPASNVVPLRA